MILITSNYILNHYRRSQLCRAFFCLGAPQRSLRDDLHGDQTFVVRRLLGRTTSIFVVHIPWCRTKKKSRNGAGTETTSWVP
jgi:hypothetical protein